MSASTSATSAGSAAAAAGANGRVEVGARVVITGLLGKKGEVRFMGKTRFAEGDWIGVVLDTPDGKNDGSVGDVRYFTCEPLHGLFVKSAQVRLDRETSIPSRGERDPSSAAADTNARLGQLFDKFTALTSVIIVAMSFSRSSRETETTRD
jgi:hypothetical protein